MIVITILFINANITIYATSRKKFGDGLNGAYHRLRVLVLQDVLRVGADDVGTLSARVGQPTVLHVRDVALIHFRASANSKRI